MIKTIPSLKDHTDRKRQETVDLFRDAMNSIEAEISDNGGIYPQRNGKITLAEVCRRAHRTPQSIQKPHHAELRDEIRAFISRLAAHGPIRKIDIDARRKETITAYEAQLRAMAADRAAAFEREDALKQRLKEQERIIGGLRQEIERTRSSARTVASLPSGREEGSSWPRR